MGWCSFGEPRVGALAAVEGAMSDCSRYTAIGQVGPKTEENWLRQRKVVGM
jgi:hypothetical protein